MSESSEEALAIIEPAATRVRDPKSGRSIWLAGLIQSATIKEGVLCFSLQLKKEHTKKDADRILSALEKHLHAIGWEGEINCEVLSPSVSSAPPKATTSKASNEKKDPVKGMSGPGMGPHGGPIQKLPIPGVKHIIAVASGKGGVGKSTVATNLAIALHRSGRRVGLMDADVYGPSLPTMMKVNGRPIANEKQLIVPLEAYGIQCMSMGFLIDEGEPIIWRGPMVMGTVKQFFQNVNWTDLDYLIVDLPPGTGDAQLTMIQSVNITGAVVVTTPQRVAVLDAVRGIEMFRKLNVPILGIVENMSHLELPSGDKMYPFGQGGGQATATKYEVPLLAQIPLDERIRAGGDLGMPSALSEDSVSAPFLKIASQIDDSIMNANANG